MGPDLGREGCRGAEQEREGAVVAPTPAARAAAEGALGLVTAAAAAKEREGKEERGGSGWPAMDGAAAALQRRGEEAVAA